MIEATIDGVDGAAARIKKITPMMLQQIRKIFLTEAADMAGRIRTDQMTGGTTGTKLRVRSGRLRASVRALPSVIMGEVVKGGVGIGTVYGRVHVGPVGQETIIRPKTKKWLTIPLKAAMTPAGVGRGSAMSGVWGDTFFKKVHYIGGSALMLFGRRMSWSKSGRSGGSMGKTRGQAVPLFLLVKQVKIPSRVHPELILAIARPRLILAFKNIGVKLA